MPTIAAVGFDLGETLLTYADTPPNWAALYPAALKRMAAELSVAPTAAQRGDAVRVLVRNNTRLHPRREEVTAQKIFGEILEAWELAPALDHAAIAAFFSFFQRRTVAYPETAAVLDELRLRRIRTGVLTDVPYGMPRSLVERDLAAAGIAALVGDLLTSVEVGWRKPEPAGFRALAAKLGVAPGQLWFVGNEEKDIAGARAAGATAVLVDRENIQPAWGQAHTVRNLRELLELTALPS